MRFALKCALAKRGAVFHLPRVEFKDTTKGKYCVLMEDYIDGAETLIVVFTTHRTEFDYQQSSVLVDDGAIDGIKGDTLIQCENWKEIPIEKLLSDDKVAFIDRLSPEIMARVDDALTYATRMDEAILFRVLPQEDH